MSFFRRLLNQVRADRLSDDIERELEFHVAERADELMAGGMSEAAAWREARRRFGNHAAQKEQTRAMDLHGWLDTLSADVRYALRALRGSPAFAAVAVLSLGLGIGANTAIFSLIDVVMLKTLPVRAPEELVRITDEGTRDAIWTNPLWEEIRRQQDVFSHVFTFGSESFNLAQGGEANLVEANWVSGDFFTGLGVNPAAGRLFTAADDVRGCPGTVVLSHSFWQNSYGGDRSIIGQTISLSGKPFQVIGVAEPSFFGVVVGKSIQLYVPLCANKVITGSDDVLNHRSMWWLRIVGRPKPGISEEAVRTRLAQLAPTVYAAAAPDRGSAEQRAEFLQRKLGIAGVSNGFSSLRSDYSRALIVLMSVVAMVLMIACANVANLLLARAASRQREIAVRLAIGAGRVRIVRQLLTESVLLSLLGAVAGVMFAFWGSRLLVNLLSTSDEPVWLNLSPSARVLGFTIAVATITGVLFGLLPAWRSSRVDPNGIIKAHARTVVRGGSHFGIGKALVSGQIALSLVLVVAAALLLGSFRRLADEDTGFNRSGVLLGSVSLRYTGTAPEARSALFQNLLERARALPGVRAAAISSITPISGGYWNEEIAVAGYTAKTSEDGLIWMNEVSDGYFRTLGIRVLQGRDFNATDVQGGPTVAVVSRTLARKFFGTENVVGRSYRTRDGDDLSPPFLIIGVVEDTKYRSIREEMQPTAYLALSQIKPTSSLQFLLFTSGPPANLIPSVTAMAEQVNPRISLRFTTLERQLAETVTRERLLATLSGFFGVLALLLATIGLYGVISYNVSQRRNEIGVRIALGSARARILRLILGEVGVILAVGLVIGGVVAWFSARLVATLLYGVSPSDPMSLGGSASILALVSLVAATLPALRAARLDPIEALRDE
jgi:putative ABC transport system permease protein